MREVLPSISNGRIQVPAPGKYQKEVVQVRRSLADMPAPSKQLNFISVVCLYTLIGLSERDIATALNCPQEQIENIKLLDAYQTVYDYVVKSIIDNEADDVRQMFAANARNAAKTQISLLDSRDEKVALAASNSILDRAGHRPVDVVEVRGKLDSTLRIEYVKPDESEPPVIDAEIISDN